MSGCADYLKNAIDANARKELAAKMCKSLRKHMKHGLEFDAIAVRGVSGMLVGVTVSDKLDIPLVVVRKETSPHSSNACEGIPRVHSKKYIIVDDCIDSGNTIHKIVALLDEIYPDSQCVGICLYGQSDYDSAPAKVLFKKYGRLAG